MLITLTIIGVIAALTIPNLMKKWEDQHTVSAVKEAYSILNNAIRQAIRENGEFDDWGWTDNGTQDWDNGNGRIFLQKISPYLKIRCTYYDEGPCPVKKLVGYNSTYKDLTGRKINNSYGAANMFQLQNGMTVGINVTGSNYYYWNSHLLNNSVGLIIGWIMVDINGTDKGPNQLGYDIFYFHLERSNRALLPFYSGEKSACNRNATAVNRTNGASCTTWITKHGNVDYKYRDVSAEW